MILNEFFNLPQVFEKDMNEFDASGYDRYSIYMDDYDLKEKFSDLDDAVEAIEAYKRDDPKSRYADYNVRDLNGKVVWRNDAWQDVPKPGKIQFLPRNDQGVAEGLNEFAPDGFNGGNDDDGNDSEYMRGYKDGYGYPKVVKSSKGKEIWMHVTPKNAPLTDRYLQGWNDAKYGSSPNQDLINLDKLGEQGVAEGMFGSRPSPVLPVVDKINKVARGLTPQNVEVGKQIIQNKTSEITRMLSPQSKSGVDVIEQGMAEAKDDYVPPKEANYDDKYQAMVKRVGQKARAQEKAKQQQPPKAPVRESRLALLKQIIQS
jgi:hypothetical protein